MLSKVISVLKWPLYVAAISFVLTILLALAGSSFVPLSQDWFIYAADNLYGATNQEEVVDFEIIATFISFFILVSIIFLY